MRLLVLALLVVFAPACSCGGCTQKSAPVPDAGGVAAVTASLVVDAGETDAVVDAEATVEPAPSGDELPYEVKEGSPAPEAIVAAYLADCHADIKVTWEDMDGTETKVDCDALAFDQNCSPDKFGCWGTVETCRAGCADPCHVCQTKCGSACDDCKTSCDGGSCLTKCAEQRASCRTTCLYAVQKCRADTCNANYDKCEKDADERTNTQCPECSAIRECITTRLNEGKPTDDCLPAGNAKECLEWCSPDQ
jgi:hypothetical protein